MIEARLGSHPCTARCTYQVAGRALVVDGPLPELAAFSAAPETPPPPSTAAVRVAGRGRLIFRGPADLGTRRFDLECRWRNDGYDLRVEGVGRLTVTENGGRIASVARSPTRREGLTEVFLGPGLTLALALQDVFCLHASAVEAGGGVIAFLGESGKGKSTLAAALPELSPDFRCAADDLLPVTLAEGRAHAWPRFPQLKYRLDRQPGANLPQSLPLAAVYLLDPRPGAPSEISVETLEGCGAVLALVRHTMAARLFTAGLLERHVELCAGLARTVPVRRLGYPKVPESLPRIAAVLERPGREPS